MNMFVNILIGINDIKYAFGYVQNFEEIESTSILMFPFHGYYFLIRCVEKNFPGKKEILVSLKGCAVFLMWAYSKVLVVVTSDDF